MQNYLQIYSTTNTNVYKIGGGMINGKIQSTVRGTVERVKGKGAILTNNSTKVSKVLCDKGFSLTSNKPRSGCIGKAELCAKIAQEFGVDYVS